MELKNEEIEEILNSLEYKIKKSLKETHPNHRADLEQTLREMIVKKLKSTTFREVPSFFELVHYGEASGF